MSNPLKAFLLLVLLLQGTVINIILDNDYTQKHIFRRYLALVDFIHIYYVIKSNVCKR